MRLQLMCCALSNLSSSQFMEGLIKRDKGKSLRGKELRGSSRYSNWRIHRVTTDYILSNVAEFGVPEFRIYKNQCKGNVRSERHNCG